MYAKECGEVYDIEFPIKEKEILKLEKFNCVHFNGGITIYSVKVRIKEIEVGKSFYYYDDKEPTEPRSDEFERCEVKEYEACICGKEKVKIKRYDCYYKKPKVREYDDLGMLIEIPRAILYNVERRVRSEMCNMLNMLKYLKIYDYIKNLADNLDAYYKEYKGDMYDVLKLDIFKKLTMGMNHIKVPREIVRRYLPNLITYINSYDLTTGLHAIEHALIKVINPNLGGLSYTENDNGYILIHGFDDINNLKQITFHIKSYIRRTYNRITRCPCTYGCNFCIKSHKCGVHNAHLDKQLAKEILEIILDIM